MMKLRLRQPATHEIISGKHLSILPAMFDKILINKY